MAAWHSSQLRVGTFIRSKLPRQVLGSYAEPRERCVCVCVRVFLFRFSRFRGQASETEAGCLLVHSIYIYIPYTYLDPI